MNIQQKNNKIELIKRLVNIFLENSFLASIIFYMFLKNV